MIYMNRKGSINSTGRMKDLIKAKPKQLFKINDFQMNIRNNCRKFIKSKFI